MYTELTKTLFTEEHIGKNIVYCTVLDVNGKKYYYIGSKKNHDGNYKGSVRESRRLKSEQAKIFTKHKNDSSTKIYVLCVIEDSVNILNELNKIEEQYQRKYEVIKNAFFVNASYANSIFGSSSTSTIWINNGEFERQVTSNEYDKIDKTIWFIGRVYSGKKFYITDNKTDKLVTLSEYDKIDKTIWTRGRHTSSIKGRVWINDGKTSKRLSTEEYDKMDKTIWTLGVLSSMKDKVSVYFTNTILVNNGSISLRINPIEYNKMDKTIWVRGRADKGRKVKTK